MACRIFDIPCSMGNLLIAARGIWYPHQGSNLHPLLWELRSLSHQTTGKPLSSVIFFLLAILLGCSDTSWFWFEVILTRHCVEHLSIHCLRLSRAYWLYCLSLLKSLFKIFAHFCRFPSYLFVRVFICVCTQSLSHVWLFATPWSFQVPLSMDFPAKDTG